MCKCTKKYTITQFRKDYPDDSACLDKIFQLRYSELKVCPKCSKETTFRRVPTRQCYQCTKCYYQIYPCAGTPLEGTKTSLLVWFYVIYLFTASKNGISAYEVQRQIGGSYKTSWRMLKQIRILTTDNDESMFSGIIEIDETFVGGKNKNRHKDKKVKKSQGRSFKDKTPILGFVDRASNRVKTFVIDNTQRSTIQPIIKQYIQKGSTLMTDEWTAYRGLNSDYDHNYVDHSKGIYSVDDITSNRVENLWSVLKRTINGSYIHVSAKYLQLYANEVAFRQNYRNSEIPIFDCLLNHLRFS